MWVQAVALVLLTFNQDDELFGVGIKVYFTIKIEMRTA